MSNEVQDIPVKEGDVVAGKYRVERVLGVGGMGVVVAAIHLHLDQRVALKFVRPEAAENAQAVERFMREARAAARLKSEHVAKVHDVALLESGMPYLVMEYLEGADLGRVLAEQGPLSIESAADYVIQACEAVAEAHAIGIVHRDIKPQNLFLTRRLGGAPMVKVLDFGISKIAAVIGARLTQTASVMGSPLYMAPEQMRSARNVDPRADIWALGVVLYELLTGRVPFDAETMTELCLKVVQDAPVPPETLRFDLPPALRAIIARCLEKDPTRRFAEAGELAAALEPFAPIASRPRAESPRRSTQLGVPAPSVYQAPMASSGALPRVSTPLPHQTQQTPASWGHTKAPPGPRRPALLAVSMFLAFAVVGLVALRAVRGHLVASAPVPPPVPSLAPPPLAARPVASASATAPTGMAVGSAVTLTSGAAMSAPLPAMADAGEPSTSGSTTLSPRPPPVRVVASPARARSGPPGAPSPASAKDDEIPALR